VRDGEKDTVKTERDGVRGAERERDIEKQMEKVDKPYLT
jgi:hypothetical protein